MTGTFEELCTSIRKFFMAIPWGTLDGDVEFVYDNSHAPDQTLKIQIRFTIKPGEATLVSVGVPSGRVFRQFGVVFMQIMSPLNVGSIDMEAVIAKLQTVYSGVTHEGVIYRTPQVSDPVRSSDKWMSTVSVPFYADRLG